MLFVNERYEPTCFSKKNKETASLRLCEKKYSEKKASKMTENEIYSQKSLKTNQSRMLQ
jgi:hypothetical protein